MKRWNSKVGSNLMVRECSAEIRCDRCSGWFPPPTFLTDDRSFDLEWLVGLTFDCPYCGWLTDCSDFNIRSRAKRDGFVGIEADT